MKVKIIILVIGLHILPFCQTRNNDFDKDYLSFGRKEPASLGSIFSALGDEPVFHNPASLAMITDNRISLGGSFSDLGTSYIFAWAAPNLSISSARHSISNQDSLYTDYTKELLKFSFGFSNTDLNYDLGNTMFSLGVAAKWIADRLTAAEQPDLGGDAFGIDLGLRIDWQYLSFEFAALNINSPVLEDTDFSYARSFSFCARYRSPSGFIIAAQTISSTTYAGSDIGINLAAQQAFLNQRLISRIQLTSFFKGAEAVMQNISGNIGYRPEVPEYLYMLQDFEISYTMSFLAMPKTVGTHMLVLTKYF